MVGIFRLKGFNRGAQKEGAEAYEKYAAQAARRSNEE